MHPDQITAELSDAERARFKALGPERQEFVPSSSNAIAGIILGMAASCGGAVVLWQTISKVTSAHFQLPLYVERQDCWAGVGLGLLICLFAFGVGFGLIWWRAQR